MKTTVRTVKSTNEFVKVLVRYLRMYSEKLRYVCTMKKDIHTRVVYRGWYFGWYWLVFCWYHTNQYQRKTRLVDFGITNLAGAYYRGVRLATTIHDTLYYHLRTC